MHVVNNLAFFAATVCNILHELAALARWVIEAERHMFWRIENPPQFTSMGVMARHSIALLYCLGALSGPPLYLGEGRGSPLGGQLSSLLGEAWSLAHILN
jgi:hypothetical protein